jgi:hypothetical protein
MLKVERQSSLKALGLTRAALENAADLAMENPYGHPRQVTRDEILQILLAAYDGKRPFVQPGSGNPAGAGEKHG